MKNNSMHIIGILGTYLGLTSKWLGFIKFMVIAYWSLNHKLWTDSKFSINLKSSRKLGWFTSEIFLFLDKI